MFSFSRIHVRTNTHTHMRTHTCISNVYVYKTYIIHWMVFASSKCYSLTSPFFMNNLSLLCVVCNCISRSMQPTGAQMQVNNYNNRLLRRMSLLNVILFLFILTYLYRRYLSESQKETKKHGSLPRMISNVPWSHMDN